MRILPKHITKDLLQQLYLKEGKSCLQIGKLLNKSVRQVSRYLQRFGIKARPFSTKGLQTRLGAVLSKDTKDKIRKAHLGKKIPIEVRIKMGSKGSKNSGWIDGRTPENKRIRRSIEYKLWRAEVFERDKYTCQHCNKRGGDLHSDHIKPFALYPKLRFSVDNGRTLCIKCHRKTDTYGNKKPKH